MWKLILSIWARSLLALAFFAVLQVDANTPVSNNFPFAVDNITLPDGIRVFYREAGNPSLPTVLLLHGFPSSSFHYRNLIPILSERYHVLAPDYPGFGFTEVPDSLDYQYTFANIATTIGSFLDSKGVATFVPYIFDYGAPVGLRLALQRPQSILALISQNGNAYVEGFGQTFWAPIFDLWNATTPAEIAAAAAPINATALTLAGVMSQYTTGSAHPNSIEPATYTLDEALLDRTGVKDLQLGLLRDYKTNVAQYPQYQAWLREHQPKLLAVWGKNDIVFIPAGASAFKRDVPGAEISFIDAGHFLLETNLQEMAGYVLDFLGRTLEK